MKYAPIQVLSSSTSEVPEIASNLAFELEHLAHHDDEQPERQAAALAILEQYKQAMANGDDETLKRFVDTLAEEAFAPYLAPYTSYVSWQGQDGHAFAIRPDIEQLMEDARYRQGVLQVEVGEALGVQPEQIDYLVTVSDHGNVTLYDARTFEQYWACV